MTVYDNDEFDSPQEALAHYRELLNAFRARKRALEVQAAKFGIHVPPHVVTELEEVNESIQQLAARVKTLDAAIKSPAPAPIVSRSPPTSPVSKSRVMSEKHIKVLREVIRCDDRNLSRPGMKTVAKYLSTDIFESILIILDLQEVGYIEYRELSGDERKLWTFSPEEDKMCFPTPKGRKFIGSKKP